MGGLEAFEAGGYFRDPSGTGTRTGTSLKGSGEKFSVGSDEPRHRE
jgi:hypothetical protein